MTVDLRNSGPVGGSADGVQHYGSRAESTTRGGEKFQLRPTPKGWKIVRLVDDVDFPGEPFWVEAEVLWRGRSREAATAFMRRYMVERKAAAAREAVGA